MDIVLVILMALGFVFLTSFLAVPTGKKHTFALLMVADALFIYAYLFMQYGD